MLDASAIGISFVKRDVDTAGQTMFLLNVGELLEDYTRAMSENELINSLLDVPDKAQKVVGDTEVSVAATELEDVYKRQTFWKLKCWPNSRCAMLSGCVVRCMSSRIGYYLFRQHEL